MTVAVQLDFHGAGIEQYDEINERIGSLPGGPAWHGELFHWVAATSDGFRVVDVWESQEAFERFARDTLRPVYDDVGIEVEPEIRFFEVHNYLAGGRNRA